MKHIPDSRHILSWSLLICLTCGFYTTTLFASPDYWPTNGWRSSTPEEQGMDSGKLIEMMEKVRDEDYAIDNITIVRNGYLVTDAYLYPFRKNTKHVIESDTKSVTSALIGIALDKGYIRSVNQPILEFFPGKTIANLDEQKRTITLEHLLTMTSGLDTKDSWLYEWEGFAKMIASENWVQYVLDRPMAHAPGKHFDYSNGGAHLLSAIIQNTTNMSALEFANKHLFGPLGITDVKWSTDPQGLNIGEGQMMLTPHDMAKFGLLYLNKGRWGDRQIISDSWVEVSTRKHISANLFDGYGYLWWISFSQYYMAVGYLGQFIFVVPEKNMVVVFTSNNLEGDEFFVPEELLDEYIIPAVVSSQPLVAQSKNKEHLDALITTFAKAPAQGFIWTSVENGMAKNGEFIRTASPAFQFKYPKTSFKREVRFPFDVMEMKTLLKGEFSASISEIPAGTKLAEVGPKIIASHLEDEFNGSKIEIVSNNEIILRDGTVAYRTDVNWLYQSSWRLRTLYVSAFKDQKWIVLSYTVLADYHVASLPELLSEGTSIVESLTFK